MLSRSVGFDAKPAQLKSFDPLLVQVQELPFVIAFGTPLLAILLFRMQVIHAVTYSAHPRWHLRHIHNAESNTLGSPNQAAAGTTLYSPQELLPIVAYKAVLQAGEGGNSQQLRDGVLGGAQAPSAGPDANKDGGAAVE